MFPSVRLLLCAAVVICSTGTALASCEVSDDTTTCEALRADTNPYLRLAPEKVIEQGRSVDNRMGAGNSPDKKEFMNTFVALQRIEKSAAQYAEAQRLLNSIDKYLTEANRRSTAEIKDDATRLRLQATEKISDCTDDKYKYHHSECGQRMMAQVPPENRDKTFMQYVDDILPGYDKNDRDGDVINEIFARHDRHIRAGQFTRDLKAAKSSTEMLRVVARYCTGRGEPRIGMTQLEVQQDTTWCVPSSINETITVGAKREQYVYYADRWGSGGNAGFLYFENGQLVAIQRHHY